MRRLPASTAPHDLVPVVNELPPGAMIPLPTGGFAPLVPSPQRHQAQDAVTIEFRINVPSESARELAEALRALVAKAAESQPHEGLWKRLVRALRG